MAKTIYADQLAHALDHCDAPIEALSLDCFDTLIWRTTPEPSDVFCDLVPKISRQARQVAEHTARERRKISHGNNEISLTDIYRCALPHGSEAEQRALIEAELAAEHQHCFAFGPCVALIRAAKQRGLKIIIVSDTYFSEAELRALIAAKAGADVLALIDKVFCSCEYGRGKTSGLFDDALKHLRVRAERVLHIGDHPVADVTFAEKHGLHSLHLVQGDPWLAEQWRLESTALLLSEDALRATVAPLLPHRPQLAEHARRHTQPAERVGYATLGPIMYGFVRWVQSEARELVQAGGKVKLCFLMRDGFLPMQVYEHLRSSDDPPAYSAEISRFTAFASSFTKSADILAYLALTSAFADIPAMCRQLLLTETETQGLVRKFGGHENAEQQYLREVTSADYMRRIVERSAQFRTQLIAHLRRQLDPQPGETLMLVDLGYAGTVQNLVQDILEEAFQIKVEGRYLLLRDVPRADDQRRGYFGPDRFDGRLLEALMTYVALIEQLCTTDYGSVVGYEDDGRSKRKSAHVTERQLEHRGEAQRACLEFIDDLPSASRSACADLPLAREHGARAAFARLMFLPTRDEAAFFETFAHDVNLGVKDALPLADFAAAREDLHRLGPMYVNSTVRMHVPSELRNMGLDLALQLFTLRRFELKLNAIDFRTDTVKLPVMIAGKTQTSITEIEALPTFEGYYAALIPLGKNEYSVGLMFGQENSLVQLESARAMPAHQQFTSATRQQEIDLLPNAMAEGCEVLLGNLLSLGSPESFLYFAPPAKPTSTPWVLRVVFRPLVKRIELPADAPSANSTEPTSMRATT